jgi:branched-chain amino acid transport system substrate-binding protein
MLKKVLFLVVALSLVGLMLPGCGPTPTEAPPPPTEAPTEAPTTAPPPPAEGPIKLGLQAPITGEYAYEGEGFVKVLELAVEQKNAAGGILGRQIEIVTCDDVGKPDESSKCAQQLVSEGVDAVIGSYSSTCTEPASAIYNEANILQVTPSSTATRLTTHGYKQFFRVCFLDDRQGLFAAKFIKEDLGIDKAAFLHDNSTYAQGLAEWAKKYYEEEYGGTSVFYDAINPEDTDFTPVLTKIMEANPGAVYFTGYHPQGGLLLKQSKDLGAEWQWVLGNACNNPEMVEISGKEAAAGAYVTTEPLPKDISYPEAQAFVEAYSAEYGEDLTSIWWLMVADAFNVIASAMEATGGTDTDAMAQYLHTEFKDYPGVTGPILGYDEKGDRLGTVHVAYVISADGEFVPYGEEAAVAPPAEVEEGPPIKIGFDIPLTGDIPKVGEGSKYAGEMMLEKVNGAGGLVVGNKQHKLEFIYEDNESKAESATAAALKLITTDKVLAIVGPQASKQAVPTGEVCETNKTPMISPWSTNPRTTADRPYVFRACFLDPFQGPVIANFATEEFGATKAAVLYDVASDYPKGLAEFFKAAFEELHGDGSVVAFETFTTKDRDFSAQLTKIVASGADFLFTPQYYDEVPLIVKQAHELGWDKPILGSDSWGSAELMTLCGDDCKGCFFSTHYAAAGAKGATKEFIDAYNAQYGYVPDDVAALTWDAMGILLQAIQNTGGLTGDLDMDREAVKDQLGKIKDFEGITGKMTFTPDGDPIKCAVIVKISDAGEFEFYKSACP